MKSIGTSRIGLVRKVNEDRLYRDDSLLLVADGMGGHAGGAIASTMAVETITDCLRKQENITEDSLREAIALANEAIYNHIQTETSLKGMGTTVVVVHVGEDEVVWGNVGDSRLYLFRDSRLVRVTKDHSIVQKLLDAGAISSEEAETHPKRNVLTRAVGVENNLEIDTGTLSVEAGDKILLCSDGLTSSLSEEVIASILQKGEGDKQVLDELISLVYKNGAKDNVTLIIATV